MTAFLFRRLAHAALVLLVVCTVTFGIVHAAPGGPSLLADPKLSVAERQAIEQRLGLDRPVAMQYVYWLSNLVRGDLGDSFSYQTPNITTIAARLPNTVLLASAALLLSIVVALPLAAMCAARPNSWLDRIVGVVTFGTMAMPAFWLGIVLILVFAVRWHLFPAGGVATVGGDDGIGDRIRHLILPTLVLAAAGTAELLRYARSSARTIYALPLVRTARAKGVGEVDVRWRHVMRNALLPIVTIIGLQLPRLVGGAAITETVFSWSGMGRLGIEAALSRDYPLVMAITLIVSAGVLLTSIVVDLLYFAIDPRIRPE